MRRRSFGSAMWVCSGKYGTWIRAQTSYIDTRNISIRSITDSMERYHGYDIQKVEGEARIVDLQNMEEAVEAYISPPRLRRTPVP
jgi:hypothetical protein